MRYSYSYINSNHGERIKLVSSLGHTAPSFDIDIRIENLRQSVERLNKSIFSIEGDKKLDDIRTKTRTMNSKLKKDRCNPQRQKNNTKENGDPQRQKNNAKENGPSLKQEKSSRRMGDNKPTKQEINPFFKIPGYLEMHEGNKMNIEVVNMKLKEEGYITTECIVEHMVTETIGDNPNNPLLLPEILGNPLDSPSIIGDVDQLVYSDTKDPIRVVRWLTKLRAICRSYRFGNLLLRSNMTDVERLIKDTKTLCAFTSFQRKIIDATGSLSVFKFSSSINELITTVMQGSCLREGHGGGFMVDTILNYKVTSRMSWENRRLKLEELGQLMEVLRWGEVKIKFGLLRTLLAKEKVGGEIFSLTISAEKIDPNTAKYIDYPSFTRTYSRLWDERDERDEEE
ncbi:hypothetical protein DASC09_030140 [Saccharomycopsis crataegensis]|uniref:Uncharacterized protein n=1 Tax=Saccharomycopsis crataegensis TaxID=43959 RepID=A0AAV5QM29_9ASCO|nr:hypothetical protein DASC09_030140 [Saccharomycopsis crataegensis]